MNMETLRAVGLAKNTTDGIRILGRGELEYPLNISATHFTAAAKKKIEAAGGTATEIALK